MASRALVVEDVEELRATMVQALRLQGGFDVVAGVADGAAAVATAQNETPDVIVLDLGLPDLAGAEVITHLRAAAPHAHIVVYTGSVVTEHSEITRSADVVVQKDRSVRYLVGLVTGLDQRTPASASITLGPSVSDVRRARVFLEQRCAQWGCVEALPRLQLVLSELVTNALVHAGTTCELRTQFAGGVVRIEVRDEGPGTPDLKATEDASEGGRGLLIVSSMAQAWGVDTDDDGQKTVWCEIPASA